MFYLKRTNQEVPAPLGLVDRLHAYRSEVQGVAQRAAESFKAEYGHNVTVEERRDVYTTQTLDEALGPGGAAYPGHDIADGRAERGTRTLADRPRVPSNFHDGLSGPSRVGPDYSKTPPTWPEPSTLVVTSDGERKEVRVGDHSPEPFVAFHRDRV